MAKSCGSGKTSRGVSNGKGGRGAGTSGQGRGPNGEPIKPDSRGGAVTSTATDEEVRKKFAESLKAQGFSDEEVRAAMAVAYNESKLNLVNESSYANTSNDRIRDIFSSTRNLSDTELTNLKQDRDSFFNYVYGPNTSAGNSLGNKLATDGSAYAGRGTIQLTGRENYARYGMLAGYGDELVRNPDLMITNAEVSTRVTAAYLKDRYQDVGLGPVGNMRTAVSGSNKGYSMNIGKDTSAYNNIDSSWFD